MIRASYVPEALKESVNRLRALAVDAINQYHDEIEHGGEPVYPAWADDMLAVCGFIDCL